MTDITLRQTKGAPLTHDELDQNFANLKETADLAFEASASLGGKANASAIGTDDAAVDMGTTPGTILSDNGTAKQWFQESEAAIEARAKADDLNSTDLGKGAALIRLRDGRTNQDAWDQVSYVSPFKYGAIGGGASGDTAKIIAAAQDAAYQNKALLIDGSFDVNDEILVEGFPLLMRGDGSPGVSLIDAGIGSSQHLLKLDNATFSQPVMLRNVSILSRQETVGRALSIGFGARDAELDRIPSRFFMENVDIRGVEDNGVGHMLQGFKSGILLTNVHRPIAKNVIIAGQGGNPFMSSAQATNTLMEYGWKCVATYHATDEFLRAAPTDPVWRDCHVYSADKAWIVRGHWEGLIFDHALGVFCNDGLDINGDIEESVGTVENYPWVSIRDSHFNVFKDNILIRNMFDVQIKGCQFHKWAYAPADYVSTGVYLEDCARTTISENTFFNLTTSNVGNEEQYDAINAVDVLGGEARGNLFSGITKGVRVSGDTTDFTYERGLWRDLPAWSGAVTPVEYTDSTTGKLNVAKGIPLGTSGESSPGITINTSSTNITPFITLGQVHRGDIIELEYALSGVKDSTAGIVTIGLTKAAGTATISWVGDSSGYADGRYVPASANMNMSAQTRFIVETPGSVEIGFTGICSAGIFYMPGEAQLSVRRLT